MSVPCFLLSIGAALIYLLYRRGLGTRMTRGAAELQILRVGVWMTLMAVAVLTLIALPHCSLVGERLRMP